MLLFNDADTGSAVYLRPSMIESVSIAYSYLNGEYGQHTVQAREPDPTQVTKDTVVVEISCIRMQTGARWFVTTERLFVYQAMCIAERGGK